jgi:hypothetical protein
LDLFLSETNPKWMTPDDDNLAFDFIDKNENNV